MSAPNINTSAEARTRVSTSILEYDLIQKRRRPSGEEKVVGWGLKIFKNFQNFQKISKFSKKVVGWGLIVTVLVFTLAATVAELVLAQITHCISLLVLSYQVR